MDNSLKVGTFEALCIILIGVIGQNILIMPKFIIQSQSSSSIVNVIYITLIALVLIVIFNSLYRNLHGMDLLDISEYIFGKYFKIIVGFIIIAYFLFTASLLLRNTSENLRTMYFQSTPTPYLLFFIILGSCLVNKYGLKAVIKCNAIIVTFILIAFAILFLLSIKQFEFTRVYPIFGYGFKNTFLDGLKNISIFANLFLLSLASPLLHSKRQFDTVSILSTIICGVFVSLTVTALLLMFPSSISSGSNVPLYLQTRAINLGRLVQRVDAFFILIWLLTMLSYISISVAAVTYVFRKIFNLSDSTHISYTFFAILFGICLIYTNLIQIRQIDSRQNNLISIIILSSITFLVLILGNIKKKKQDKKMKGFQNV